MLSSFALTASAANSRNWNGITWEEWTSTDSLPNYAGYWYLTKDVNLTSRYQVPDGGRFWLDLNGKTVNINVSDDCGIYIEGSALNLYDSSSTGTGKITRIGTNKGSGVWVNHPAGEFNMYGGTISGFEASENGGGVCVSSGFLKIYGGSIQDNKTARYGGGVYVGPGVSFQMNGGSMFGFDGFRLRPAIYNIIEIM